MKYKYISTRTKYQKIVTVLMLFVLGVQVLMGQDLEKYSATYIAKWAGDTACIETFTIAGMEMFGRSIQIFPEPHLQQFIFRYGKSGAIESFDIQYYDLKNTSRVLESVTGYLPYNINMRSGNGKITFIVNGPNGESTRTYNEDRIDYLGSWIPIMGQWEWLSRLMVEDKIEKDLTFINKALGVYDLDLARISSDEIIFHGGLSLPITIFLGTDQRIDSIDAIGVSLEF